MLLWFLLYLICVSAFLSLAVVLSKAAPPVKYKRRQISLLEHNINYFKKLSQKKTNL